MRRIAHTSHKHGSSEIDLEELEIGRLKGHQCVDPREKPTLEREVTNI
jgi:hypothetical protein